MFARFIVLATMFLCVLSYGGDKKRSRTLFGIEMTFASESLRGNNNYDSTEWSDKRTEVAKQFLAAIGDSKEGEPFHGAKWEIGESSDKSKRTYRLTVQVRKPDGKFEKVEMEIFQDQRVMEITMTPGTVDDYRNRKALLQKVYDVMATADMRPHPLRGGGHIHTDVKTGFRRGEPVYGRDRGASADPLRDRLAFRNYLALLYSNQWLADGGLRAPLLDNVTGEAPILEEKRLEAVNRVLREFDASVMSKVTNTDITKLARDLYNETGLNKAAVNLAGISGGDEPTQPKTVEYRGVSAYQDPDTLINQLEFFDTLVELANEAAEKTKAFPLDMTPPIRNNNDKIVGEAGMRDHFAKVKERSNAFLDKWRPKAGDYESVKRLLALFERWKPYEHVGHAGIRCSSDAGKL